MIPFIYFPVSQSCLDITLFSKEIMNYGFLLVLENLFPAADLLTSKEPVKVSHCL